MFCRTKCLKTRPLKHLIKDRDRSYLTCSLWSTLWFRSGVQGLFVCNVSTHVPSLRGLDWGALLHAAKDDGDLCDSCGVNSLTPHPWLETQQYFFIGKRRCGFCRLIYFAKYTYYMTWREPRLAARAHTTFPMQHITGAVHT